MNRYSPSPEQGLNYEWYRPSLALTISIALADIISDMMSEYTHNDRRKGPTGFLVISIPLLLLRNSSMKLSTKIGIVSFLSLSIFMIICSIIRAAGFLPDNSHVPETSWRCLWQELEACISVIMASVTVFRTLQVSKHGDENQQDRPQTPSFVVKWYSKKRWTRHNADKTSEIENGFIHLPNMPSATFTGIRSFIRRNHWDGASTIIAESDFDPTEADYHVAIRGGLGPNYRTDGKRAET